MLPLCDRVVEMCKQEARWAGTTENERTWMRIARSLANELVLVRQMAAEAAELEDGLSMTMQGAVRVSADEKRRDALRAIAAVIQ